MFRFRLQIGILLSTLLITLGCTRSHESDPRLERAGVLAADSPREALAILDSVCPDSLSAADRHLYGFFTVKASDKAYITHTSDSLILSVIDYTASHRTDPAHRAEALYYGGRVYSDLGDLPTALSYFQQALDQLPDTPSTITLRGLILSQTGQLMRKIGLYPESIPYTEKVLELRRSSGNIKGEYFSLQALGYTYYKLKKYNQSELYYRKALNLARALSPEHRAIASVDLADVKLKLGETDSALFLVRNAIDSVNSFTKNSVLATGAKVYLKAGITDSAYIFARKLIRSSNHNNRHVGYYVLLSPEMRKFSSQDSLMQYISEYRDMTHKSIEDVGSDMVINKYNYYDYKKHDRDKADALAKVAKLKSVIIILIICLVISINFNLFSFFAYLVKRRGLKVSTSQSRAIENHKSDKEKEELRKKLLSDITSKSDSDSKDEVFISDLKDSYIFSKLKKMIKQGEIIPENGSLWKEIEEEELKKSPKLMERLHILTGGTFTEAEKQLALLIRMGLDTTEMGVLLARSKGAIDSRRSTLCARMFGQKLSASKLNRIIMNL